MLSQDPAARAVVALGTAVALVVRAGVPNVLGLTRPTHGRRSRRRASRSTTRTPQESPGPVGIVLSQTPARGPRSRAGTKMTLVLSIAPRVAVPNVVGSLLADATAALTRSAWCSP